MLRRLLAIAFALLAAGLAGFGLPIPPAAAADLAEGQVVVAFVPQLTGDPAQDFSLSVKEGDVFRVFLMAGPLPDPTLGYRFGLRVSEPAGIVVQNVRAPGIVTVDQNSIGTLLHFDVSVPAGCLDSSNPTPLAVMDLVGQFLPQSVSIDLVGANYDAAAPPEYDICTGGAAVFDDSPAMTLTLNPVDPGVPIDQTTWSALKALFDAR